MGIYAVMPLSLVFIGIDWILFGGQIKMSLPVDPRIYIWFVLLFMLPHIFASFFSFAEKEYFDYYRGRLLRGAQIAVLLGIFLPALAGATILPVIAFVTYTMIHVFMQQSGVSKSLMRNTAPSHIYWQWLGITISTVIYAYLLIPSPWLRGLFNDSSVFAGGLILVVIIYCLLAVNIVKQSQTTLGKIYFLGTHILPILGVFYIIVGYPILALIISRIIHDLTAYTFYIAHDSNRFKRSRSNFLYIAASKIKLPVYIASPVVSILLAITVSNFNSATISVLLTCFFFLHYYTESVIWKNNTLHRTEIKFSPYK